MFNWRNYENTQSLVHYLIGWALASVRVHVSPSQAARSQVVFLVLCLVHSCINYTHSWLVTSVFAATSCLAGN